MYLEPNPANLMIIRNGDYVLHAIYNTNNIPTYIPENHEIARPNKIRIPINILENTEIVLPNNIRVPIYIPEIHEIARPNTIRIPINILENTEIVLPNDIRIPINIPENHEIERPNNIRIPINIPENHKIARPNNFRIPINIPENYEIARPNTIRIPIKIPENTEIVHPNTIQTYLPHPNPEVDNPKCFRIIEDLKNNSKFFEMWKNCLVFNTRASNGFPYQGNQGTYIYKTYGPKDFDSFIKSYPARRAEFHPYHTDDYLELSNQAISYIIDFIRTPIYNNQKCLRCHTDFRVSENESTQCLYPSMKRLKINKQVFYSCCNSDLKEQSCASFNFHTFHNMPVGCSPGPYKDFISTQNLGVPHKIFGMDCEMIYTDHGFEVASVSVVSFNSTVLLDTYVYPEGKVYDLCTNISGIKHEDIENGLSLSKVRKILLENISSNDILVGHGLENDLICLKIVHRNIIDTSLLPWNGCDVDHKFFKRPSLKFLADKYLNKQIRVEGISHSSIEDAFIALELAEKFIYSI